jgi:hypothetical protein
MGEQDLVAHWDDAYGLGDDTRSWFQQRPTVSLRMLDGARISPADSLVDVGGGIITARPCPAGPWLQ